MITNGYHIECVQLMITKDISIWNVKVSCKRDVYKLGVVYIKWPY